MGAEDSMKKCPYCGEYIRNEAVKCRYCHSILDMPGEPEGYWRRVNRGKRVAGVCTGLAEEFGGRNLILPLRLLFVVTAFVYGIGLIVYLALWILMPPPLDTPGDRVGEDTAPALKVHTADGPVRPRRDTTATVLSFVLIAAGMVLILALVFRGHGWFPFHSITAHGPSIPFAGPFAHLMPSIWPFIILAGLLLILLGGFRLVRIALGCALMVVGSLFLLLLIPFIPLMLPVVIIVGIVLIIIGGIRLIL